MAERKYVNVKLLYPNLTHRGSNSSICAQKHKRDHKFLSHSLVVIFTSGSVARVTCRLGVGVLSIEDFPLIRAHDFGGFTHFLPARDTHRPIWTTVKASIRLKNERENNVCAPSHIYILGSSLLGGFAGPKQVSNRAKL